MVLHPVAKSMRDQRGFVLLLVVVTLAICCLVFYQLAALSFRHIRSVLREEREVRQRWTVTSTRKTFLKNANLLLSNPLDEESPLPKKYLELEFQLNGQLLGVRLEDENCKPNLHRVWQDYPVQARSAFIARHINRGPLRLRTELADRSTLSADRWREVFADVGADTSFLLKTTDAFTLWGSGHINVLKADLGVLEDAWGDLFGYLPPEELLTARERLPLPSWQELSRSLGLRESQQALADQWFSTESHCFSIELTFGSDVVETRTLQFVDSGQTIHHGFEY